MQCPMQMCHPGEERAPQVPSGLLVAGCKAPDTGEAAFYLEAQLGGPCFCQLHASTVCQLCMEGAGIELSQSPLLPSARVVGGSRSVRGT